MREIKFRGKRVDNGEWVYGYYFESFTGIPYIMVLHDHILAMTEFYEVDPSTVGQWISFQDKNGKDIYEGDVLMHSYGDMGVCVWDEHQMSYLVKMLNGEFAGCHLPLMASNAQHHAVVGNIHDNPELFELLEGEKHHAD